MERSLTEGNSFKQIIWFAFPLLLGNLFQQLYNLADTVIVGKTLGINALASVGASSSLNFLILGFVNLCSRLNDVSIWSIIASNRLHQTGRPSASA